MSQDYQECITACQQCAAACDYCASACLHEEDVNEMSKCIQLDIECAVVCRTAAQLMSLGSEKAKDACRICSDLCDACANECGKHKHEHCRECAEACRECAEECRRMAA